MPEFLRRNREMTLREFEQLLNLFFPANHSVGAALWQKKPFQEALRSFLRDSVVWVSPKDLAEYAERNWLPKRRLSLSSEALSSFREFGIAIKSMRM